MIEIYNFEPKEKGSFKANFSIKIEKWGGFIIHKLALFEKDGKQWVSMPTHKIEVNGQEKWVAVCLYDKPELNKKLLDQIKEALDIHISKL